MILFGEWVVMTLFVFWLIYQKVGESASGLPWKWAYRTRSQRQAYLREIVALVEAGGMSQAVAYATYENEVGLTLLDDYPDHVYAIDFAARRWEDRCDAEIWKAGA